MLCRACTTYLKRLKLGALTPVEVDGRSEQNHVSFSLVSSDQSKSEEQEASVLEHCDADSILSWPG